MLSQKELANAIRILSMDAVQNANSGHPGAPMGMADIAEVLWNGFLKHSPTNPKWFNRDRFILSNGHASMLLYALLHLSGYDLSIDDLKQFRQLHSKTPGHPEFGYTPGVETTTGPLGQGLANAVGFAIAEKILAEQFNRKDYKIINHYTYVFIGDGCLMEGISHEVCSLAGTLGLGKLIVFWDDNGISIDGEVKNWFSDNTPKRFEAYNWHVIANIDGHDPKAISNAILEAQQTIDKPSLICCKTTIGYGAPNKSGTHDVHGAPLGEKEIAAAREYLNWAYPPFEIPHAIKMAWDAKEKGKVEESQWQEKFAAYKAIYPELAQELTRRVQGQFPANWEKQTQQFIADTQQKKESIASRKASQQCIEAYAAVLPELLGGSADLTSSNLTFWKHAKPVSKQDADGNYLYYGVREFGMSAIMNGITLHGGFIPFGGTFLTFSDYARNAIRMSSLMKQRVIYIYTHDSIGLGEDGPTHQPIEHLAMLRLTPGLSVWRPCDAVESAIAWKVAIENQQPTCLIFSRQNLPHQHRDEKTVNAISRGAYILKESHTNSLPQAILIATGSEVSLAIEAANQLEQEGYAIRVVSMPSTDVFDKQDKNYQETVLPPSVTTRIAIEAAAKDFWYKYVGQQGNIVGMTSFGESAPAKDLYEFFGFTIENIVKLVKGAI
ncbi:MAG: Transketolase 2 [Legionellaceae bacterium]